MLFIIFIASFASTLYVDVQSKCQCEELLLNEECTQHNDCFWDEDKCIDIGSCSFITSPVHCIEKVQCAYVNGQCGDFTKCSNYQGDKTQCESISELCTSTDGKSCVEKKLMSCSEYDEDVCNESIGQEGECIFKNGKCKVLENCNEVGSDTFKCMLNIHSCKPQNGECVDKECQHLQYKSECEYVHAYDPQDKIRKVELCEWVDGYCKESKVQNLDKDQCFQWLEQAYHWQNSLCVQCQGIQPPTPNYALLIQIGLIFFIL